MHVRRATGLGQCVRLPSASKGGLFWCLWNLFGGAFPHGSGWWLPHHDVALTTIFSSFSLFFFLSPPLGFCNWIFCSSLKGCLFFFLIVNCSPSSLNLLENRKSKQFFTRLIIASKQKQNIKALSVELQQLKQLTA